MNEPIDTKKPVLPKRKHPRLNEFDYSLPYPYFVTIGTHGKQPIFGDHGVAEATVQTILDLTAKHGYLLYAYCLMPDHLHLLARLGESGCALMDFVRDLKGLTTKTVWSHGFQGKVWQSSFHEHVLRKEESIQGVAEYIIGNPVRRGLVDAPEEYEFSGMPVCE